MALPPLEAGADQVTVAEALPAVAVPMVGVPGTVAGAPWTEPVPESVKVLPAIGRKTQS